MRSRSRIFAALCLFAVVLNGGVAGCGGSLALTGGSIPIGVSRLQGKVVRADDIGRPIVGAPVRLSQGTVSSVATTDANGQFTFDRIAGGTYLCTIYPSGATAMSGSTLWSYNITVPDKSTSQLVATILPVSIDPATIAEVKVTPNGYSLNVGESVRFSSRAYDASGNELPIHGSLMLAGDVGELSADGTLQATKVGTATLVSWSGNATTTAEVQVIP